MKRWLILAGLVIVLTSAATVAVQFLPEESAAPGGVALPAPTGLGPQPTAEVEGDTTYKFGAAPQQTTLERDWVIKNTGKADLELRKGPPACSCTIANFAGNKELAVLKPGESIKIHLAFETREYVGKYHKSATVYTSDPTRQSIELAADGEVHPAVVVYPDRTVNFLEISNDEPEHRRGVAFFSPDKPEIKITKLETSRPEVVATKEPLTEDDCKQLKAKAGWRVLIVIKAGLPLGSFREEVVIGTDHPMQPEVRVTLVGQVVGPITVSRSRVVLRDVSSSDGLENELKLVVRGHRPTKFAVESKPSKLQVEVEPSEDVARTGVYRLRIIVPPGTPSGTIEGEVVLKTDHPQASEVKIPVQVFVRDTR